MKTFNTTNIPMTDRIKKLKEELYRKMPEIEVDRAVLIRKVISRLNNFRL